MKSVLITVQGINENQGYLYEQARARFSNQYKVIRDFPINDYFDLKPPKFLGKTLGDIWTFYKNQYARILICEKLREFILAFQADGYEVDVLGHSLGTIAAICAGEHGDKKECLTLNRLILLGSPLGLALRPWRKGWFPFTGTIPHAQKFSDNLQANIIHYYYGNDDFISKIPDPAISEMLGKISKKVRLSSPAIGHASDKYLDYIRKYRLIWN